MTLIRLTVFIVFSLICIILPAGAALTYSYDGSANLTIDSSRIDIPETRYVADSLSRYIMGVIYDNFGDTEDAIREYNKSLEHKPDNPEVYVKLGADFMLQGELDRSEETLKKAVSMDPGSVDAYILLGIINTSRGEFSSAERYYEEALKCEPDNIKVLTFLSDLFVVQHELDKAAEVYEKILDIRKNDAFLYFNLGIIYSKLNLLDKAEEKLTKAIEVDTDHVEAQMVLGLLYEVDGKHIDAIQQYEKVINIDPKNKEAHVRLGQLYHRLGETEKAIAENRALMDLDRDSYMPYLRNFSIYVSEKRYGDAERVLKDALKNGISNVTIFASLGYLAGLQDDHRKAIDYYTVAVEAEPDNNLYRFYLATSFDRIGRKEEAMRRMEELVAEGEERPELYNYLGYSYVLKGKNLDRAIMLIKKAIAMKPDNGAYVDSLGWAYYKKEMLDEAAETIEQAVRLMPDDPVIRDHLGDVYFKQGRLQEAAKEWEEAFKLDPGDRKIKKKLDRIKIRIEKNLPAGERSNI